MKHRMLLLVLALAAGCGGTREEAEPEADNAPVPQGGGLQSDPQFYKLNSVVGQVTTGGKAVSGAKVKHVASGKVFDVLDNGTFVIVLDPKELGSNKHELEISAPGCRSVKRKIEIRENNQVRMDVELEKL
jgi:hypothetical protein